MNADERALALVAGGGLDDEDRRILRGLRALVAAHDPVPADLVERIGVALTVEALQAEVAELHLVGEPALAVRADESIEAGTITFTTDVLTVMISVHPEGGGVRVDGWAAPAGELTVELHQGGGISTTTSDPDGRFSFAGAAHGPARLVLRRASDPEVPVVTPQIEL